MAQGLVGAYCDVRVSAGDGHVVVARWCQEAEALAKQEAEQIQRSAALAAKYHARVGEADTLATLQAIAGELSGPAKKDLLPAHLAAAREAYRSRRPRA